MHSTPSEYLFSVPSLDFTALRSYKVLKTSSASETCSLGTAQFLETLFFSYKPNCVVPTGVMQNFKGRKSKILQTKDPENEGLYFMYLCFLLKGWCFLN